MSCHRHHDRPEVVWRKSLNPVRWTALCQECRDALPPLPLEVGGSSRNYATGLGPEAHAEAQEAGRLQQEYERSRSEPREYISRGGRRA